MYRLLSTYLLTYGLISADRTKPLSGRNPFVPDALSGFSGEIPLFVNKVPPEEIEKIKDIDKYLHACVLDIDIDIDIKKIISGSFRTSQNASGLFPLSKPYIDDIGKKIQWISIVGPIPVTLINAFYFSDKEAKDDFVSNLKSSNIVLPDNIIKLWKKNMFASAKSEENFLNESPDKMTTLAELTDKHWHKLAYGGALALAFSASKNGQESSDKFKELASGDYVKSSEVSQWNAGNDFSFICDFLLSDPGQSEYEASDFKIQLY